ncbi:putative Bracovirus protein MdBV-6-2 [Microplitis demolitor]
MHQLSSEIHGIVEKNMIEKFINHSNRRNYMKFDLKVNNLSIKSAQINRILNETFQLTDVAKDGNCLFRTFAELVFYDQERYIEIKLFIIYFIICHKSKYESLITHGAFSVEDKNNLLMMRPKLDDFLRMISREGHWGNEGSIYAMSDALNIIIITMSVMKETHEKSRICKYLPNIKYSLVPFTIINGVNWHFIAAHRKFESPIFDEKTWQDVRIVEIRVNSHNIHSNVSSNNSIQQNKINNQQKNSIISHLTIAPTKIIDNGINNHDISKSIDDSNTQKAQLIADQIHSCKCLSGIINIIQVNQNVILKIYDKLKNEFEIYLRNFSHKKTWPRKKHIVEGRFPNIILNNFFLDNVDDDGNCLFRTFAEIILNDEKRFYEIKIFVIHHVTINLSFYENICTAGEIEVRTSNESKDILESSTIDDFLRMVAANKIWGNEGTLFAMSQALQTKIILFSIDGIRQKLDNLITINLATLNTSKKLTIIWMDESHYHICRFKNRIINFTQYIEDIHKIKDLRLIDYDMNILQQRWFS